MSVRCHDAVASVAFAPSFQIVVSLMNLFISAAASSKCVANNKSQMLVVNPIRLRLRYAENSTYCTPLDIVKWNTPRKVQEEQLALLHAEKHTKIRSIVWGAGSSKQWVKVLARSTYDDSGHMTTRKKWLQKAVNPEDQRQLTVKVWSSVGYTSISCWRANVAQTSSPTALENPAHRLWQWESQNSQQIQWQMMQHTNIGQQQGQLPNGNQDSHINCPGVS